jgi:hypothetical protein
MPVDKRNDIKSVYLLEPVKVYVVRLAMNESESLSDYVLLSKVGKGVLEWRLKGF